MCMCVHILYVFPWRALAGAQEDRVEPFLSAGSFIPQGLRGSGGQASSPCVFQKAAPPPPTCYQCVGPRLPSAAALRYQEAEREEKTGGEARQ